MIKQPRFAVAMAAYNGSEWISDQIDSILDQKNIDVTIFVSIDKSTDSTEHIIQEKAMGDARIILLPQTSPFGNAAKNFFRLIRDINYEQYDYLALSDQDDIWFPEKLFHAHLVLKRNSADAYSSNVIAFWPNGKSIVINKAQPQRKWDFLFEGGGPGCTYVLKTTLANELKVLLKDTSLNVDQIALHDWFIYAYARTHGYNWYIDNQPGLMYRQHSFNHFGTNIGWRSAISRLFKVRSGWYRAECRKIAFACGVQNSQFVRNALFGGWHGNLFLAFHSGKARRRFRDRIILVLSCLTNIF